MFICTGFNKHPFELLHKLLNSKKKVHGMQLDSVVKNCIRCIPEIRSHFHSNRKNSIRSHHHQHSVYSSTDHCSNDWLTQGRRLVRREQIYINNLSPTTSPVQSLARGLKARHGLATVALKRNLSYVQTNAKDYPLSTLSPPRPMLSYSTHGWGTSCNHLLCKQLKLQLVMVML